MVELNRKTRARPVIDSQINSESSSNTQQNGSGASMNGDKPKKFIQPTIPVNRTKFQQEAPAEQKPIRIGGEGRDHQSSGRRKGQDRPKIVKVPLFSEFSLNQIIIHHLYFSSLELYLVKDLQHCTIKLEDPTRRGKAQAAQLTTWKRQRLLAQ